MKPSKRILSMDKVPEYKFVDELLGTYDTCPIMILNGQFKGIVYKYGKISLNEVEDGNLAVTMDIELITSPENFDKTTKEFTHTVGEIFVDIVDKQGVENEPVDLEADVHEDPMDIS